MPSTYSNIANRVGGTVTSIGSYLTKLSSLTSSDEMSSSAIRDMYLNGFLGDTTKSPSLLSRLFDEPTYLTFRIEFNFSSDLLQNRVNGDVTSYDYMPEPFLSLYRNDDIGRLIDSNGGSFDEDIDEEGNLSIYDSTYFDSLFPPDTEKTNSYSTYNYLKNHLGEKERANLLIGFINTLMDIQNNYPYYFQSIEGLGDLGKVNPAHGIRIKPDEGILTIKCLEGLDLKITQLMQLYRKIVWDDVYQRWILPDMMRYFTMKIYVSEIRLFHSMSESKRHPKKSRVLDIARNLNTTSYDISQSLLSKANKLISSASAVAANMLGTNSVVSEVLEGAGATVSAVQSLPNILGDNTRLCNNALNDVMPTICYECHMCEFIIDDTLSHINSLNAFNEKKPVEPTIKIRVGRVMDKQLYPLNALLTASETKYTISQKLSNQFYIDDDIFTRQLRKNARSGIAEMNTKEDTRITAGQRRINKNISTATSEDLVYQLFNSPKDNTLLSLTYSILHPFSTDEALSAATTIKKLQSALNTGEIANMIKSTATSEEEQRKLKVNLFTSVLENLSQSSATEKETALAALSNFMLDELRKTSSEATNPDNKIEF